MPITFTIVESPYAPKGPRPEVELARNLAYVRAAMHDCFGRGEVPFASHALYTQPGVLDDLDPIERETGILAGRSVAAALALGGPLVRAFYLDRGESRGMMEARGWGVGTAVDRRLGPEWSRERDIEWIVVAGNLYPREVSS
jgi:hypothetical protein